MSTDTERQKVREALLQSEQFAKMPDGLKEVILHSPTASQQFEAFFSKGSIIRPDDREDLAHYRGTEPPQIVVSQFKYLEARLPHRDDMRRSLFSIMAHEIGHDAIDHEAHPFRGSTEEEYVAYRAEHEAMAIQNTFPIFKELSATMPDFRPDWNSVGYLQGIELAGLYSEWEKTQDNQAAIDAIAAKVAATPYSRAGMRDMDGDGHLTQRDQYLRDFRDDQARKQQIRERTTPEASDPQANLFDPRDPAHPDHKMYRQTWNGVREAELAFGKKTPDKETDRVAASLLVQAKREGLTEVNHVVFSQAGKDREGNAILPNQYIFAVQGELDALDMKRAVLPSAQAAATPEQDSFQQLAHLNRDLERQQEQQLAQQKEQVDPTKGDPKLS